VVLRYVPPNVHEWLPFTHVNVFVRFQTGLLRGMGRTFPVGLGDVMSGRLTM
jgi:hypothetical protein